MWNGILALLLSLYPVLLGLGRNSVLLLAERSGKLRMLCGWVTEHFAFTLSAWFPSTGSDDLWWVWMITSPHYLKYLRKIRNARAPPTESGSHFLTHMLFKVTSHWRLIKFSWGITEVTGSCYLQVVFVVCKSADVSQLFLQPYRLWPAQSSST